MVPTTELPPTAPLTDHATEVSLIPVTTALNCRVEPAAMDALEGETFTFAFPEGGVMVKRAAPKGFVSAVLMALIVIVAGFGTVAGAVYTAETDPEAVPGLVLVPVMVPRAAVPP
jgi:hypothetical protein